MSKSTSSKSLAELHCPEERIAALGSDARLTPHRREVYRTIAESCDHPTAYDVFDRVKNRSAGISLATVYNCLEHLTHHRLVKVVQVDRSQARYCANIEEHGHFHCETCGKVTDAHPLEQLQPSQLWNLPAGTKVTRLDIAIHGLCPDCSQNQPT